MLGKSEIQMRVTELILCITALALYPYLWKNGGRCWCNVWWRAHSQKPHTELFFTAYNPHRSLTFCLCLLQVNWLAMTQRMRITQNCGWPSVGAAWSCSMHLAGPCCTTASRLAARSWWEQRDCRRLLVFCFWVLPLQRHPVTSEHAVLYTTYCACAELQFIQNTL